MNLAYIPSPSQGVWHLGVFPIRGYALCIIAGVIVAVLFGDRRWVQRGGSPGAVGDIAVWAVPFGLVGGRLYHVLTDPELYFGAGRHPVEAFYIWRGGLGIWGAIALGALGAYIGCRRHGLRFAAMADALAPAVALAQAIGRWGNWFNQELYGKPTNLPWGLKIDERHRLPQYVLSDTFHPTFLYEFLYDLGMAGLLILIGWRFRIKPPGLFALYVALYTFGRTFEELLRVDPSHHFLGERLNFWVSAVLCVGAVAFFVWWQFFHESGQPTVKRKPREVPKGPAMAVPKGRVRPRR